MVWNLLLLLDTYTRTGCFFLVHVQSMTGWMGTLHVPNNAAPIKPLPCQALRARHVTPGDLVMFAAMLPPVQPLHHQKLVQTRVLVELERETRRVGLKV
jgi:hypothetical protein